MGLRLVPLFAVLAFMYFVWGVARFIKAAGNEKEVGDSKKILIWGVVGLLVLTSIWGIISFLKGELRFGDNVGIPQIKFEN